jgi:two-component system CheB/CheR fusion protein
MLDKGKGKLKQFYLNFTYQAFTNDKGKVEGILVFAYDVTEQVNATNQIEANALMIRNIYMNAPAAICTFKGPTHIYELVNPAYQKLFDKRDLVGKPILEAMPELKGQGVDKILDNVYNTGEVFKSTEIPVMLARADNMDPEQRYFNTTMQPIYNEEKKIIGVVNFGYDVTEQIMARKQIEESEAKFRTLSETIPHMVWTATPDGKKNFFNKYFLDYTGKTFEELVDDGFRKIIFPADLKEDLKLWHHSLKTGEDFNMEKRIRHHNGTYRWHVSHGVAQRDMFGNITGWIGSSTDIDEHKSFAKDLGEAIVFAEMATLLAEDEKEKAESALASKQQFLSNMSHEIRTPMNAIIGFTKVLLKTELSEKQKEYLHAIKSSGNTLIVLINDILDLAKVNAGKMKFTHAPFSISASLNTILQLFEAKIEESNLELVKEFDSRIPKILLGDSVRLHQILINLISNAIKFTANGKIIVSVNLLNEEEEKVTLEIKVTDTGIGIPQNKIKDIFENFEQATDITSNLYGGTGLGLAIVKQLVEKQGGTISVKSKVDEGSTFSFTLSFEKTNDEVVLESGIKEVEAEFQPIKVLVVEDVKLNQLLMRTILDDFKFAWDIADNGKIAIEKLQTNAYDIILMDLQMPIMNGFEATEHIRNKMNLQIPIIALTADVTTTDLEKCKAVGMNDYISKPLDEKLLYSKICDLLKSK